jgi:threonine/homoserine/homoserine lactone efflux protein
MTEKEPAQTTTTARRERCARALITVVNARSGPIVRWSTTAAWRYFLEMLNTLFAFVGVSAVVICTPGPDTALMVRNTISGGRASGIATAAGVTLGILTWAVAASAGVVALLRASEPVFQTLKLAGAAYLAYLGLVSLWAAVSRRPHKQPPLSSVPLVPRRAFRQGCSAISEIPRSRCSSRACCRKFVPDGSGAFAASLALGLLFATMGLAWLTTYAVVVAKLGDVLSGPVRRMLDAVTGAILVALGVRLATEDR